MMWYYIVIAFLIGIISGFGYYDVTKSEFRCNYEMQELIMMLRNEKRNAIIIGISLGVFWPLTLVVLASIAPKTINSTFDTIMETKDVDLTNHNIVLDKPVESDVSDDNHSLWIDFNDVNENR